MLYVQMELQLIANEKRKISFLLDTNDEGGTYISHAYLAI